MLEKHNQEDYSIFKLWNIKQCSKEQVAPTAPMKLIKESDTVSEKDEDIDMALPKDEEVINQKKEQPY